MQRPVTAVHAVTPLLNVKPPCLPKGHAPLEENF